MCERGVYQNPKRGKQLLRFDGMKLSEDGLSTITPTDIDALMDIRDRVLIVFEVKLAGKNVPQGQRLALERMVKDAKANGKNAVAIVVEHNVEDAEQDVYLKDLIAREAYSTEYLAWKPVKWLMTAKELADWYVKRHYRAS